MIASGVSCSTSAWSFSNSGPRMMSSFDAPAGTSNNDIKFARGLAPDWGGGHDD